MDQATSLFGLNCVKSGPQVKLAANRTEGKLRGDLRESVEEDIAADTFINMKTLLELCQSTARTEHEPLPSPVDSHMSVPVVHPVSVLADEPVSVPVDHPVSVPVDHPVSVPVDKPLSVQEDQPLYGAKYHPLPVHVEHSMSEPGDHPVAVPAGQPVPEDHPVSVPEDHPYLTVLAEAQLSPPLVPSDTLTPALPLPLNPSIRNLSCNLMDQLLSPRVGWEERERVLDLLLHRSDLSDTLFQHLTAHESSDIWTTLMRFLRCFQEDSSEVNFHHLRLVLTFFSVCLANEKGKQDLCSLIMAKEYSLQHQGRPSLMKNLLSVCDPQRGRFSQKVCDALTEELRSLPPGSLVGLTHLSPLDGQLKHILPWLPRETSDPSVLFSFHRLVELSVVRGQTEQDLGQILLGQQNSVVWPRTHTWQSTLTPSHWVTVSVVQVLPSGHLLAYTGLDWTDRLAKLEEEMKGWQAGPQADPCPGVTVCVPWGNFLPDSQPLCPFLIARGRVLTTSKTGTRVYLVDHGVLGSLPPGPLSLVEPNTAARPPSLALLRLQGVGPAPETSLVAPALATISHLSSPSTCPILMSTDSLLTTPRILAQLLTSPEPSVQTPALDITHCLTASDTCCKLLCKDQGGKTLCLTLLVPALLSVVTSPGLTSTLVTRTLESLLNLLKHLPPPEDLGGRLQAVEQNYPDSRTLINKLLEKRPIVTPGTSLKHQSLRKNVPLQRKFSMKRDDYSHYGNNHGPPRVLKPPITAKLINTQISTIGDFQQAKPLHKKTFELNDNSSVSIKTNNRHVQSNINNNNHIQKIPPLMSVPIQRSAPNSKYPYKGENSLINPHIPRHTKPMTNFPTPHYSSNTSTNFGPLRLTEPARPDQGNTQLKERLMQEKDDRTRIIEESVRIFKKQMESKQILLVAVKKETSPCALLERNQSQAKAKNKEDISRLSKEKTEETTASDRINDVSISDRIEKKPESQLELNIGEVLPSPFSNGRQHFPSSSSNPPEIPLWLQVAESSDEEDIKELDILNLVPPKDLNEDDGSRGTQPHGLHQKALVRNLVFSEQQGLDVELWDVESKHLMSEVHLATLVCGFLNSKTGGTVYAGVNRDGLVRGLPLNRKDRDLVRQMLDRVLAFMVSPRVPPNAVDICFIPVVDEVSRQRELQVMMVQAVGRKVDTEYRLMMRGRRGPGMICRREGESGRTVFG